MLWTVVLEKTLESPLDCNEIQPVHPKDQCWVFTGRTDIEAETPVLWPPHAKSWLIGKDSDAGRDWGQEEKGMTEGEMAAWHHWLDGRESGWTPGVGDGQGGLACYGSWGHKELDMTEWLNNSKWYSIVCIRVYIYMHHIFIHSSVDGHWVCLHVLGIVNSVSMNIGIHVLFEVWFSLDICPVVGLLDHMVVLFLVF